MGLGGYLTWTAVSREISKNMGIKTMPYEQHGQALKLIKSPIFHNNPNIAQELTGEFVFPLQLNNPASNYCLQDLPDRAIYRRDVHIIEHICEFYGITSPKLKCELYLTDEEKLFARDVIKETIKNTEQPFVVVEPHSNFEYTVNRQYPLQKWQYVIDIIRTKYPVVQIGVEGSHPLDNVINMVGKTTFRQGVALIGDASLCITTEGGLVHAATSQDTTALVVIGDQPPKKMVQYPQNIHVNFGRGHGPCGMKTKCQYCEDDANSHDPNKIVESALYFLDSL